VFALISELTAADRIGYVGLDNWKVGRTAAWAIAQIAKRAGEVGIIVGSHRYRCQELNEMGFRSYFREHAPDFTLLEARTSLEDARYGAEATRDLLARHPDLVGLYIAGGGVSGVMEALRENVRARIVAVGHDLTPRTREGLIDGTLELTLSHPLPALGKALVAAMARSALGASAPASLVLPFELHTAENL
jgi:LacI family transcriptional regulator